MRQPMEFRLCRPAVRMRINIHLQHSPLKIKTSPERTPLDRWLLRQSDRLDSVGNLARGLRLAGSGMTPLSLRQHLIRVEADLATWRAAQTALAEFAALRRDVTAIERRPR